MHYWNTTNEVLPFVALHLWYDQLHCDLYRIAMPNFNESAPPEYQAQAPPGWLDSTQLACYRSACSVMDRFGLLEQHFPDLVLTDRYTEILVYESMRNQLQYLKVSRGSVQGVDHADTIKGFEMMIRVVGRMTRYYANVQPVVNR